jgi:hypothetical protein
MAPPHPLTPAAGRTTVRQSPRPSHGLGPVEPHLASDGEGTSFNPLLKVVPNPGHARQTLGSPRSGGIGGLQPLPPFDVERPGVHVEPLRGLHVATYVD